MPLKWTKGNTKLKKTAAKSVPVIGFGIPADYSFNGPDGEPLNTCPGALACRAVCYAKQGSFVWPNVIAARTFNLQESMKAEFAANAIADLQKMPKYEIVRIHDSGDFYSQNYLNAWKEIAAAFPNRTFYAYTKAMHLDFSGAPKNLRIVQSLGGKHDSLVNLNRPHSRIFSSEEARKRAGYVNGNESDLPAIRGKKRIGLVYHGVKKLTESQKEFFG